MDKTPSPFLALPFHIRKRIYVFANLIRPCPILIVPRSRAVTDQSTNLALGEFCRFEEQDTSLEQLMLLADRRCICPAIPKELLLVNKALHKEVQEVLYGENTFAICAHRAEDLEIFRTLPSDAIHALRHLVVRIISLPSPDAPDVANGLCRVCCAPSDSASTADASFGFLDSEWMSACQRLAQNIAPMSLNLGLITDAEELSTIKRTLNPLSALPCLRDCTVWLNRKLDPIECSFARSSAVKLTTYSPQPPKEHAGKIQSRFASLPPEIRLRILSFTILGCNGPFAPKGKEIAIKDGKFTPDLGDHDKCRRCKGKENFSCPIDRVWRSYSPHCQCRERSLDLLLASWQVYADGTEVLYSTNTFQFSGSFTETLKMLQSFRPDTLKRFRRIRFNFEFNQTKSWARQETAFLSLFSFIGKNFNVPQLLLILDTTNDYYPCVDRDFGEPTMRALCDAYSSIIRWVKFSLPGLGDLHVFLGMFYGLETIFEKYVMGQRYDSKRGNRYSKAAKSFDLMDPENDPSEVAGIPYWHRDL